MLVAQSVHFSFEKITTVLGDTPPETDAESKIQRLLGETGQGGKESEETKDEILGEVLAQALSCPGANHTSQFVLFGGFLFPHWSVTDTGCSGEGTQGPKPPGLSPRTERAPGSQVGAPKGMAAGAGAQRLVNSNMGDLKASQCLLWHSHFFWGPIHSPL